MKKIFMTMAAASALAVGAPAAAQYGNSDVQARVQQLQVELQAGIQSGGISRNEAVRLREQLRELRQLERQYGRDGISGRERGYLMQRINGLRQEIRVAVRTGDDRYGQGNRYGNVYDRDRDGRDDRYERNGTYGNPYDRDRDGRDDRYEQSGTYGNPYDQNRNGLDDRYERNGTYGNPYDRDRDGRDDRYEQDDRYGNVYDRGYDNQDDRYGNVYDRNGDGRDDRYENSNRGGIGGILGSILGGNSGLRVGQRVSANMGGVPYEYRDQFRDGNGVYYRSDGRNIYQIDARSQTVVRIFPMR